jgi:hypothetical protein
MPDLIKNPKPHMVRSNYVDMSNPGPKKKAPAEELDATIEESMQPAKKSAASTSSKEGSKSSGGRGAASANEDGSARPTPNPERSGASATVTSSTEENPGKAADDRDWLTPLVRTAGVAASAAAVYAYLRESGMPEKAAQKMAQTAVANPAGASDLITAATGDDAKAASTEIAMRSAGAEDAMEYGEYEDVTPKGVEADPRAAIAQQPSSGSVPAVVGNDEAAMAEAVASRFANADDAMMEASGEFGPEPVSPNRMVGPNNRFMKQGERVNQYSNAIPGSSADWLDEAISRSEMPKPRVRVKAPGVRVPAP